jgi:ferredoxin
MIDKTTCIGCGACAAACPVQAISFDQNGKAMIDPEKCIKCGTCEAVCPVGAIKII